VLSLGRAEWQAMKDHAEKSYPHEGCGILAGKAGEEKITAKVIPLENVKKESKETRYLISPDDFRREDWKLREEGLEILGFFHSHPDVSCRASEFDLAHAWPWYSYLILSVRGGKFAQAASWVLNEDKKEFLQEEVKTKDFVEEKIGLK